MRTVYTIGYEGTDIDRVIATLKAVGIKLLADVRAVAISRKKGFSKNALRARLAAEGIAYEHYAALGDPKPGRVAAREGRHDEFLRIYSKHLFVPEVQGALALLAEATSKNTTCLLCFERDPKYCHRSLVVAKLEQQGISSFDLFGDLPRRYDNFAKLPRRHFGEGASAA